MKPGTWAAVVRSETPMPWRQMLAKLTFTKEEWCRDPVGTLDRVMRTAREFIEPEKR